ncbi:MAG: amidohydrolase family protein [bacterium]
MNRRTFTKNTLGAIGLGLFRPVSIFSRSDDFDFIIKSGLIIDGSGAEGFVADIGIQGEKIVAVGKLEASQAYRVIDAEGLVVAPGFIDVHSHSEDELLVNPKAESKIRQGVTTEILGQDGNSIAPLTEDMQSTLDQHYQNTYGIRVDWRDFADYFQKLKQTGTAVNVGTLVGQGTLREFVVGTADRPASFKEFKLMQKLAADALQQGALGISSGLEYTPGAFASREELIAICKTMQFATGIYVTHIRDEADYVLQALDEAIEVAKGADVSLHISHLKCMGRRNWSKLADVFEKFRRARFKGVSITMDRYPYTAYNTSLSSLFPVWAREGDSQQFLQKLRNPELLPKIKEATLEKIKLIGSWDSVLISSVELEKNKYLLGKRVSEVVSGNGSDGFDFVRQLIIEENNGVDMCGFAMSDENTRKILSHPSCMVATDASARADYGKLSHSNPHPRTYGTFPRVIAKYVKEEKLFSLEEAIRKMTNLPAVRFGIKRRGKIRPDFFADLVIFHSAKIKDRATYNHPHRYPAGIKMVLVNGRVVIEQEQHTGALPGKIV